MPSCTSRRSRSEIASVNRGVLKFLLVYYGTILLPGVTAFFCQPTVTKHTVRGFVGIQEPSKRYNKRTVTAFFLVPKNSCFVFKIQETQLSRIPSSIVTAGGGEDSFSVSFPAIFCLSVLVGAIGVFYYANERFTPEIIQGAQQLRQESREAEVRKLVEAVDNHTREEGKQLEELRAPLEAALGLSLENYVAAVEAEMETTISATEVPLYSSADQELAAMFSSIRRRESDNV